MGVNYQARDEALRIINEATEEVLTVDPYYYIAPYLHDGEITKDCPFFKDNDISLPAKNLDSEDLKTISYLAKFYRNRLAYDPANINRYMWATGHVPYDKKTYDILCFQTNPYTMIPLTMSLEIHEKIAIRMEITL